MNYQNIKQAKAIEQKNKERLLKVNPLLPERSGIYIMTRHEDGFRYAYIGQAGTSILGRLAQHLVGHQHIDLSIKKHGLFSDDNPCGWRIGFIEAPKKDLDELEQQYIKSYANGGYQLRNKTGGSQGEGKKQIDEYRPQKGYRDGLKQGRKNLARELKHIIDKHLTVAIRPEKQNNKVSVKALEKFNELLEEREE